MFDSVGVAEAEGWDQTELMYFVFEFGTKKGVQFCREYYEMKNSACSTQWESLRRRGGISGLTLVEWFAGRGGWVLTTLGGKMLNPRVEISRLGLGGLQEVIFHGRLEGRAGKDAGRVDMPNVGEWQCSFCMAPHCWNTRMACYKCGTPRYWESGAVGQGGPGRLAGKGWWLWGRRFW